MSKDKKKDAPKEVLNEGLVDVPAEKPKKAPKDGPKKIGNIPEGYTDKDKLYMEDGKIYIEK